jgi:hypothetical protein
MHQPVVAAAAARGAGAAVRGLQLSFRLLLLLACCGFGLLHQAVADYYTTLGIGRQATTQQIRVRPPQSVSVYGHLTAAVNHPEHSL